MEKEMVQFAHDVCRDKHTSMVTEPKASEIRNPSARQKGAAPPQEEDSTSPGALLGAAELVKLRFFAGLPRQDT